MTESPLIKLSILRVIIIVSVAVVIGWTLFSSLSLYLEAINPRLVCNIITPFGGIFRTENCPTENKSMNLTQSLLGIELDSNSTNNTSIQEDSRDYYLHGRWSFSGYDRGNTVHASINFKPDNTYTSTGEIQLGGISYFYDTRGVYEFDRKRMLLHFVSDNHIQSIYLLYNMGNRSFSASNPNSMESYNLFRFTD